MNGQPLLYNIGITLLPGVGDITSKSLIAYCGSAQAVFSEKKSHLEKIPGAGSILIDTITNSDIQKDVLLRAEEEIKFIEKNNIIPLFFTDSNYPKKLKECNDSPALLYTKGNMNLNAERMVAVVGSRKATTYGKKMCEQIIEVLAPYNVLVVSGLAYGIDICAHRAALRHNLSTVAALAHGLDNLYPAEHYSTSEKMLEHGGIVSEFMSNTKMNPEYFPRRNRIVAGMTDATIVIEATVKSGALITAELANSYDREVFAVPGRLEDISSEGCNLLIKANKAMLIQSAEDIVKALSWDVEKKRPKPIQSDLFAGFTEEEQKLVDLLKQKEKLHVDDLCLATGISMGRAASLLLNLEFAGVVKSLPGKQYVLNH